MRLCSRLLYHSFFSKINYENKDLNIGLPVFTIHGNHDDPCGEGNLSAVDVLSSCGLVNYFGKSVRFTLSCLDIKTLQLALLRIVHTYSLVHHYCLVSDKVLVFWYPVRKLVVENRAQADQRQSSVRTNLQFWNNLALCTV